MNKRGFTLIELIIIISIMAILMAIAVPATRSWRDSARNKEVAREVLSLLRHARSQAVTDSQEQTVNIDVGGKQYNINGGANVSLPKQISWEGKEMLNDAWSAAGTYDITFRPQGSCTQTIYLRIQNNDNLIISIPSTATGLARL